MTCGKLIVLSGPSGVGKGTILNKVLECDDKMILAISATTRKPRGQEIDGVNYHFKSVEEFENLIEQEELLEYAQVYDNYYGTLKAPVMKNLESGHDVILEIDPIGAMKIKKIFSDALTIFLLPPSIEILKERLRGRATESEAELNKRVLCAKAEIETSQKYDYNIVNKDVEQCATEIINILKELKGDKVC